MKRTVSSFRPGGRESVSRSVKNPYLYSCLTNPSMVSVAVLIENPSLFGSALRGTLRANAVNGNLIMRRLETFGQPQRAFVAILDIVNIENPVADVTIKMKVLPHIRA